MDNQETQGNNAHKTQNKNKQSQKHNTENYNDIQHRPHQRTI
jgi:hypothetical protein